MTFFPLSYVKPAALGAAKSPVVARRGKGLIRPVKSPYGLSRRIRRCKGVLGGCHWLGSFDAATVAKITAPFISRFSAFVFQRSLVSRAPAGTRTSASEASAVDLYLGHLRNKEQFHRGIW